MIWKISGGWQLPGCRPGLY